MAAALAALITTIAYALPATAQPTYPSKPIRFILPNAPGGSNDVVARLVGEKLTASWDQPVVIDSRPGGNNVIAAEALLKSTPDGHTILLITAAHAINPLLFPKMPYDAIKDFSAVATLVKTEYILVVNAAVPATNLREFIALAKARPGQLNAAGSNTGGIQHLALELFNMLAGVKLQHVPYKGGGPGMIDLVGGQVQAAFNNAISVIAVSERGTMFNPGPCVYMHKIAVGPDALALYELAGALPGLRPEGFQLYDGHNNQPDRAAREAAVREFIRPVLALRARAEAQGARVPRLVCGGTPSFPVYAAMTDVPGIECSPGTFVLHDAGYGPKYADLAGIIPAAVLVTRVVSRPTLPALPSTRKPSKQPTRAMMKAKTGALIKPSQKVHGLMVSESCNWRRKAGAVMSRLK